MAYVSGQNQQPSKKKKNIFDQEQGQQQTDQEEGDMDMTKTSTSTQLGDQPKSAPSKTQSVKSQQTAPRNVQKLAQKTSDRGLTSDISKKAGDTRESLRSQYQMALEDSTPEIDYDVPDLVSGALGGDEEAFSQISNILAGQGVPEMEFDVDTKGVEELGGEYAKTQKDLAGSLRQRGGPTMTSGEAAYQAQLLGYNPEFKRTMEQLGQQYHGLRQQAEGMEQSLDSRAQSYADYQNMRLSGDVQRALSERQRELVNQAREEARAQREMYDEMAAGGYKDFLGEFDTIEQMLNAQEMAKERIQTVNPDLMEYYQDVDPSQFVTGPEVAGPYFSPEAAGQMQTIYDLLGVPQSIEATEPTGGPTFDETAYMNALLEAAAGGYQGAQSHQAVLDDMAKLAAVSDLQSGRPFEGIQEGVDGLGSAIGESAEAMGEGMKEAAGKAGEAAKEYGSALWKEIPILGWFHPDKQKEAADRRAARGEVPMAGDFPRAGR